MFKFLPLLYHDYLRFLSLFIILVTKVATIWKIHLYRSTFLNFWYSKNYKYKLTTIVLIILRRDIVLRYRRDLWTTIQLIILLFFDSCQSLEKKITPLSVVPYSKNAPIIYSLWQRRGSISNLWKGCVPPGKLPSSQILIAFLRSFSREKNISIYIYIFQDASPPPPSSKRFHDRNTKSTRQM